MRALLSWHLFITCPSCHEQIDLVGHDDDGVFAQAIFSNKWDELENSEVDC